MLLGGAGNGSAAVAQYICDQFESISLQLTDAASAVETTYLLLSSAPAGLPLKRLRRALAVVFSSIDSRSRGFSRRRPTPPQWPSGSAPRSSPTAGFPTTNRRAAASYSSAPALSSSPAVPVPVPLLSVLSLSPFGLEMGKSGGRKKKSSANHATTDASHDPAANSTAASAAVPSSSNGDADPPIFLKRAQEHKEEGNRFFQSRDYPGALRLYEQALRLLPASHPDRAVFHSNCAANSCSPTTRSPTDFGRRICSPRRRRRTSHRFRSPPRFHLRLLSFVRGFAHGFTAPGFRP